jgi:hypothetical protein
MKLVLSLSLILFFSQTRTFSPAGGGGGASEVAAAAAAKYVANAPNARSAAPLVLFASDATTGASGAESRPASTSVDRKAPTTISSMSKGDSREGADAAGPVTEKSPPEDAPGRGAAAFAAGESTAKPAETVPLKASGNEDRAAAESNRAYGAGARPEPGEHIKSIRVESLQCDVWTHSLLKIHFDRRRCESRWTSSRLRRKAAQLFAAQPPGTCPPLRPGLVCVKERYCD